MRQWGKRCSRDCQLVRIALHSIDLIFFCAYCDAGLDGALLASRFYRRVCISSAGDTLPEETGVTRLLGAQRCDGNIVLISGLENL